MVKSIYLKRSDNSLWASLITHSSKACIFTFWLVPFPWHFANYSLSYPLNLFHRQTIGHFPFSSITLTISMAHEPSSYAGFETYDFFLAVRCQKESVSVMCLSASTLAVVHTTVFKLITVIRLKRRELGSTWPVLCFLWTSPVRRRTSHTGSG